jgi:hypothetical protein
MYARASNISFLLIAAFAFGGTGEAVAGPKTVTSAPQINAAAAAPNKQPAPVTSAHKIDPSAAAPTLNPKVQQQMLEIRPLSKAQKLDRARALGIATGAEGVRGTVALSPRRPWLDQRTVMQANFTDMVRPDAGSDGVITIRGRAGNNAQLTLLFRAAANSDYLIDCAMPREGTYDVYMAWNEGANFSRASASSVGGHVTFAAPETAAVRDMIVYIGRTGTYTVGRCEITEVR